MLPVIYKRADFTVPDFKRLTTAIRDLRRHLHQHGVRSRVLHKDGSYSLTFIPDDTTRVAEMYNLAKELNAGISHAVTNPPHLEQVINRIYGGVVMSRDEAKTAPGLDADSTSVFDALGNLFR
jgi:hypothetical protein